MAETHLYAVALLAVRLDPRLGWTMDVHAGGTSFFSRQRVFEEDPGTSNTEFTMFAESAVAASEEAAKEICLQRLRERFPEAEGWTNHAAITHSVDLRAAVQRAHDEARDQRYAQWSGGASGAEGDAEGVM